MILGLAIGGPYITSNAGGLLAAGDWTRLDTWAALLVNAGTTGLQFLPAAVAAYISYGMAGKLAAIPGIIGGMAALAAQGGLLAALVAGLVAGAATLALQRIPVPAALRGLSSTVLLPLLATLASVVVILVVVKPQLAALTTWLQLPMARLQFFHPVLLGVVLGLLVCSDLGGALTKTAIAFGTVGVSGFDPSKFSPMSMTIMAAVVAAGMVPPLGMALATLVRRRLFTEAERTHGKAAWLFGAAFIPEGVLPFTLADPLRVIPASMAGGAVSGALVMNFGTTITVPYGGVLAIGHVGKPLLFAVAVSAGALVTAGVAVALKSLRKAEVPVTTSAVTSARTPVPVAG